MKTLVVYYSLEGNTQYVAEKIAELTGADTLRLELEKPYPAKGFLKYIHGGKDASTNASPKLVPYAFNAPDYDQIILATPVWARTFVPPLRTFIEENKESLKGKHFAAYAGYRGAGSENAFAKMAQLLGIPQFEHTLALIDPKQRHNEQKDEAIAQFCKSLQA